MRTRFQNIDYFSPLASEEYVGTFLSLRIPELPSLSSQSVSVENVLDLIEALPDSCLEIETFPIDGALSVFLSQVLPCTIQYETYSVSATEEFSPSFEDQCPTVALDKDLSKSRALRFEEPVVLDSLESCCMPAEVFESLFDAPELKENLDSQLPKIKFPGFELITDRDLLSRSIDVEKGTTQDDAQCEVHDGYDPDKASFMCRSISVLEVVEINLRSIRHLSIENLLQAYLENVELSCHEYDFDVEKSCMFGPVQHDILDILVADTQEKDCLEYDFTKSLSALDPIKVTDIQISEGLFDTHLEEENLFIFEESRFLDMNLLDFCATFLDVVEEKELEKCLQNFGEKDLFSFNTLVVSRELTLTDDMFISLPVPIMSDDKKMRSFDHIFQETLNLLQPLHFSASDEIYLDWQLLDTKPCDQMVPSLLNISEDLNSFSIDIGCESISNDKLFTEVIFSDDASTLITKETYENLPGNLSGEFLSIKSRKNASLNLMHNGFERRDNEKSLTEGKLGNSSLLFKNMSQSNDLDFFLNPGTATVGLVMLHRDVDENQLKASNSLLQHEKLETSPSKQLQSNNSAATIKSDSSSEAAHEAQSMAPDIYLSLPRELEVNYDAKYSEIVIVVNTRICDKDMIVSRRSCYQKILEMEKGGAQIVERDLDLPVDIVLSCAACLLWYDSRNIGKKSTTLDEGFSSLQLCIENIATNVLTSLSFSFSSCILIFEGDYKFITTVMEFSDSLYVAAASLGLDLQLFYSYSSELTDYIITSSILSCSKIPSHNYSKIPESETLAESFLTKFPSLNSLSALAILSEDGPLYKFLGRESNISTNQKYKIPQESIALFNSLCRFGERDDSRSIMTDCSSSISSGPGSDKRHVQSDCDDRKRRKCFLNSDTDEGDIQPQNLSSSKIQEPGLLPEFSKKFQFVDCSILDGSKSLSSSLEGLFTTNGKAESEWLMDSHSAPQRRQELKTDALDGIDLFPKENSKFVYNDVPSFNHIRPASTRGEPKGSIPGMTVASLNHSGSESQRRERKGSVPDISGDSLDLSTLDLEMELLPHRRKPRTTRQLSFGETILPDFSFIDEIKSDVRSWVPVGDQMQSFIEDADKFKLPQGDRAEILEDGFGPDSRSTSNILFNEEMAHLGMTPLSKALHSATPQPSSPWTIEFLNRIREKSRLRKQHTPCSTPAPGCTSSLDRIMKRKNPSVLVGTANPSKTREKKKQDQSRQTSHSVRRGRTSSAAEFTPFTPLDKRAKQTLSFTRSGAGSQTRLVWGDASANRLNKRFRFSN